MNAQELISNFKVWAADYGLRLLMALLILVVGGWVSKRLRGLVARIVERRKFDATIGAFLANATYVAAMAFVIVAVLGQLGIQTASFVAVVGAAGLAVGLALQGSLSNFAAGFLLILFRPFVKGDYILGAGVEGAVEEIQVFCTILNTPDGKRVIVPNSKLTGDNIINFTARGTRRVDLAFGVDHGQDVRRVRQAIQAVLDADARVLKDPAAAVVVKEMADTKMVLELRAWVKSADYGDAYSGLMEAVKLRFVADGISTPIARRVIVQSKD
ncbi:MAG TPA: mechanosensitive ion channel domain-containing protein [Methylomirabilota bacterium]|nr:mechanosensitive ion channel domain-containing protein [Methylomirabilota bacterium]